MQWNPAASYTLDVADFAGFLDQAAFAEQQNDWVVVCAKLVAAVDLYQGDLLPDCYDDWLLAAREQWQQRYSAALTTLVCGFEAQQNFALAISYAQRLLRHDPLHEATYRHLMRLYARNGESARATQTLTCVNLLQRELGVEPEAAIQAEVEREILRSDPKPRRFGIACLNYPHNCPANQPQKDRFGIAACDMLGVAVAVFRPFPSIP